MTIAQNTIEFDTLLLAAVDRAKLAHPGQRVRIEKGLQLVLDDAVTDMTRCTSHTYAVRSSVDVTTQYTVVSNGVTTCTCPDYASRGIEGQYWCKHIWGVFLVKALRRDLHKPHRWHAYHAGVVDGNEGHMSRLSHGRVMFYPWGGKHGFACARKEVYVGQLVEP